MLTGLSDDNGADDAALAATVLINIIVLLVRVVLYGAADGAVGDEWC